MSNPHRDLLCVNCGAKVIHTPPDETLPKPKRDWRPTLMALYGIAAITAICVGIAWLWAYRSSDPVRFFSVFYAICNGVGALEIAWQEHDNRASPKRTAIIFLAVLVWPVTALAALGTALVYNKTPWEGLR